MIKPHITLQRARYALKLTLLYSLSLSMVGYVLGNFSQSSTFATSSGVLVSTQQNLAPPIKPVLRGLPVRLVIDRLELDLPVAKGEYDPTSGTWSISDTQAYYATPTPLLNDDAGTTLIYGHNDWRVFNILHLLDPGDTLRIYTEEGLVFHYVFRSAQNVEPTDVAAIRSDGPPKVILQTCTGNWNQWRRLFEFTLDRVEP